MSTFLNVFQPELRDEEAEAVRAVMHSNWIGRGEVCLEFERQFAEYLGVGAHQLLSITSCTDGLFMSMDLLGIGEGDMVIMPTISFIGAANAVASRGARPLFCDVDPSTLNITIDTLMDCMSSYPYVRKSRFKAVIVLHYGGYPCADMDDIAEYCGERGVSLIEDSACSVASKIDDTPCGVIGDIGLWSFDAMKIMSTGDGGMAYFRRPIDRVRAAKRAFLGMAQISGISGDQDTEWWKVDVDIPGRRFLMNDLTAAIGIEQLKKLPSFVARRQAIHQHYTERLSHIDWLALPHAVKPNERSSYYLYWVQTASKQSRDNLARYLRENNVYTTYRYYPLHWVRYYATHFPSPRLPYAERAADTTLCLPIHQGMSDDDVDRVCDLIEALYKEVSIGRS